MQSVLLRPALSQRRCSHAPSSRAWTTALTQACALSLAVVLLLAASPSPSFGQTSQQWLKPFGENTGKELLERAAAEQARENAAEEEPDAVILVRDLMIEFDDAGRLTSTRRSVVHLLTQDGVDYWSDVSAYWSPWHEARPTVRARIVSGETDRLLSPDTLFERTAEDSEDIYGDRKVLEGPLPAVAIGAVVDLEVTNQETAPFFAAGSSFTFALDSWFPIIDGTASVRSPEGSKVLAECGGLNAQASIVESQTKGHHLLHCAYSHAARDLEEFYSDRVEMNPPQVRVSTATDWNGVASEYSRRIEDILANSKEVLAAGADFKGSRDEKINQALDWMQERIRYTGLELGESAIIPYAPKTVLDRGYGDCKDLATILIGLLAQTGVAADIALVRPGRDRDVNAEFPGIGRFTHAIVRVNGTAGGDDGPLWVDPTSQFSAAGELPSSDQGRWSLIANPETSGLVKTPDLGASANGVEEVRRVVISSYGNSDVSEVTEYTGDFATARRNAWVDATNESLSEALTDYASSTYGVDQLSAEVEGIEGRGTPLELTLNFEGSVRFVSDLYQAIAVLDPTAVLSYVPTSLYAEADEDSDTSEPNAELTDRTSVHYEFPSLHRYVVRYLVEGPVGMALRELPEASRVELPGATFESSYRETDGGSVEAEFAFDLHQRRLTADELKEASVALTELASQEAVLLWFDDEASALLELGNAKEALELRQRLAAENPTDPVILSRLAMAWLSVGLRDAALAAADEAVAKAPNSALAHWARSWVLRHGETASQFGPGFDHGPAVESLKQAVKIAEEQDEDASEYRLELAILLEYDVNGIRYRGDLAAANALIEEQAKSDDPEGTETNYIINLFRQKKYQEVRDEWKNLRSSEVMQLIALAAEVAEKGTTSGMRLVRSFGKAGKERANLLANAAAEITEQGYFDEASELLRAAAPASGNAAAYLNRARLLESAASLEETLPDDSPQGVAAQALVTSLLSPELTRDKLEDMFHPLAKDTVDDVLWAYLIASRTEMVRAYAEAGQALGELNEANKAVFLAAFDVNVEGDPATGWKVVLTNSTSSGELSFLLAMQDGQPQLVSWDTQVSGSVLMARDFFLRDDFAAAKRWLEWSTDVLPDSGDSDSLRAWLEDRDQKGRAEDSSAQSGTSDWLALRLFADLSAFGFGDEAMELHDRAVAFASQQEDPELERRLEWTLVLAYLYSGDLERAQASFDRAWQGRSTAGPVGGYDYNTTKLSLFVQAEQLEKAIPLARKMMEQEPDNELGASLLSDIALELGDLPLGIEAARRVLELKPSKTGTNNNLAWMLLFGDDPQLDEARRLAERGAARATHANQAELHTLATVYAFSGDPQTALATIRQSLALHPRQDAEPHDWIVFGQIAEYFGQDELAIDFYNRVLAGEDEEDEPPNTKALASRRLRELVQ